MRIASYVQDASKTPYLKNYDYNGVKINVTASDFKEFMAKIV